jgi:hypothetical protein
MAEQVLEGVCFKTVSVAYIEVELQSVSYSLF